MDLNLAQLKIKNLMDSTPPATYPTFTATSLLIQLIFSHYIHTTQLGGKSELFLSQKMLDKGLKVKMEKNSIGLEFSQNLNAKTS